VEPLRRLAEGFMLGSWCEREREGRFLGTELVVGNVGGEVARWWKGGGEDIGERLWVVWRKAVVCCCLQLVCSWETARSIT
jgi:hypothetical protein